MKVKLEWTEEVTYHTVLEIDEAELAKIRQWKTMDFKGVYHPEDEVPEVVLADVADWLTSGEESDWFDRCDATRDLYGVTDRTLEGVTEVKEGET